jgi:hypothetical protein
VTSLEKQRKREIDKLLAAFEAAAERIELQRIRIPALNVLDFGYYVDGSMREVLHHNGFNRPTHRVWEVDRTFGRRICIYEDVDYGVWQANNAIDDPERQDQGTYQLAFGDPSQKGYGGSMYLVTVGEADFESDTPWSLDTIITVRQLLKKFYTPKDVRRRIKRFTKEMMHSASVLVPA